MSGVAGGIPLVAPPGRGTRPTTDRVREATFNALGSMGVVEGAGVLDLFAGSGAMGIEALSRGAAHATFVERERAALEAITRNLRSTRLERRATVVADDAMRWLGARRRPGYAEGDFTLAICDPPYAFDRWVELLAMLPAEVAVIESAGPVEAPGWHTARSRRYAATVVTIARRSPPTGTTGDQEIS